VDKQVLWVVDGYTTSDHYPQSQRNSFSEMTNDSLSQPAGVQTLPTDDINYMRNAVKATVNAYTGQVTLYAWDETDPILQAWRSAFPDTVLDRGQIPADLLPHLRYPEDMFKVQRFQYAHYHVTSPSDFFSGTNWWEVPEDPTRAGQSQTPIRMFTRNPEDGQQMWSLTSNYVPRKKSNLAGFLAADSNASAADYGNLRVEIPATNNTPGPGQAYTNLVSDPRISDKTQSFRLGDATPRYGNVVSVPMASGMMYVVPVYATRTGGTESASYLTLRYVMVSYGARHGIGETLVGAIADLAGSSQPPPTTGNQGSQNGNGKGNPPPKGGGNAASDDAKARVLLEKAQRDFAAADQALQEGRAAEWVRLSHRARAEVARALNLLG
jgi:uncharacterized protein